MLYSFPFKNNQRAEKITNLKNYVVSTILTEKRIEC